MGKGAKAAKKADSGVFAGVGPMAAITMIGVVLLVGLGATHYLPVLTNYFGSEETQKEEVVEVMPNNKVMEEVFAEIPDDSDIPDHLMTEKDYPVAGEHVDTIADVDDGYVESDYVLVEADCLVIAKVLNDEVMRAAAEVGCEAQQLPFLKKPQICSKHTGKCGEFDYLY